MRATSIIRNWTFRAPFCRNPTLYARCWRPFARGSIRLDVSFLRDFSSGKRVVGDSHSINMQPKARQMNTVQWPTRSAQVLCFAAALSLVPASLVGQEETAASSPPRTRSTASASPGYVLEISNGQFESRGKGAPAHLGNLVDALRDLYPDSNIVLAPGVRDIQVDDLKLRATSLNAALEALRVASGYRFEWKATLGDGQPAIDPTTGLPVHSNAALYVLSPAQQEPQRAVTVFNLAGYFEQLGMQAKQPDEHALKQVGLVQQIILDTFSRAYEGEPNPPGGPHFVFHQGANLLVVIGSPDPPLMLFGDSF